MSAIDGGRGLWAFVTTRVHPCEPSAIYPLATNPTAHRIHALPNCQVGGLADRHRLELRGMMWHGRQAWAWRQGGPAQRSGQHLQAVLHPCPRTSFNTSGGASSCSTAMSLLTSPAQWWCLLVFGGEGGGALGVGT